MKVLPLIFCLALGLVVGLGAGVYVGWHAADYSNNPSAADASNLLKGLETGAIQQGDEITDTRFNQYVSKPWAYAEYTQGAPEPGQPDHVFRYYLHRAKGNYISIYVLDDAIFAARTIDLGGERWFFFDKELFDRYLGVSMPRNTPASVEE
jgi:hypothetical protein